MIRTHLIQGSYFLAAGLFIYSLRWMSHPKTARRGVIAGVAGMALAIIGTLIDPHVHHLTWIAVAFIVLVTCFLALDPNTRVALYVGPVWFAILALGYRLTKSPEPALA